MGKMMENCWFFMDDQSVWAVCTDCMEKGLDRNEYWVNVVPQKICSFHAFKLKINSAPIKALCNTKEHEISISRSWFSRKNMKKPSAARAAGIEMSRA